MFHTMDRGGVHHLGDRLPKGAQSVRCKTPSNLLRHLTIERSGLERHSEDHARKVRVTHHGPLPSSVVRGLILQEEQRLLVLNSAFTVFTLSVDKRTVLRKEVRQL